MFRGNHPTRVDEKGRLKVPAEFKRVIDEKYGDAILHHQPGWQGCPGVSLRGMGADRAEAGRALHFQSYEEKVSGPGELLRAEVEMDGQGRLLMPQLLREAAQHQGRSGGDSAI